MSFPLFIKKEGKVFVNTIKRYTRTYWLTTDPVEITVAGGGTSDPVPMLIDNSGHLELFYVVYYSTNKFLITVNDPSRRYDWMNKPIHIDTFAGKAGRPHILPETYFLNVGSGSRQLTVQFTDISGVENKIRLAFIGRRYLFNDAPREVSEFMQKYAGEKEKTNLAFLTTEQSILNLGAGDTFNTEFRVTSDAYFEIQKQMAKCFKHGDLTTEAPFEFSLEEYSSGRKLMPGLVRGECGWGDAEYPFVLPETLLLERDYRIKLSVTNLLADPADMYFTIAGRRISNPENA